MVEKNAPENMDTTSIKNLGNGMFFRKYYITMQRGKHTRLILETMRVCCPPPATAGEYLHTLANTFFRYSKSFPHGAETHYQVCRNSPYLNLDELVENPVEDIQGNLVNLFELPVDDKDDKVALQDIPQRKNKMLKWQYGEHFRSKLNNIGSMSYLIEDDEIVMKEASKKQKLLNNFSENHYQQKVEYCF